MTQTYEAWRITYQSSEQAARAAFERMMELEQGKCLHQIAEPAEDIWPCINIDVDEHGAITNAKLYSPGLPAGNHDVYPVRVPYMDEHTEAWLTCVKELERFDSSFLNREGMNGIECAASVIRELVSRAQRAAAPQAVQPAVPEAIEQMAVDRYKVVPSHESMFHRWAVVAGNGTQQLYIGREVECLNMSRKFAGAFLDGAFVAMQNTTPAHPAEGVPAQDAEAKIEELLALARIMVRAALDADNKTQVQEIKAAIESEVAFERAVRAALASTQPAAPQAVQPAVPVGGQSRFKGEKDWQWCAAEHVAMVLATPSEWQNYEVRYVYAHPAEGIQSHAEAAAAVCINSALKRIHAGKPSEAVAPLEHALSALAHLSEAVPAQCPNINEPRGCWRVACQLGGKCREPERAATQPAAQGLEADGMYYLQDARHHAMVGNCPSFWREGGGYTTNLDEAEHFTLEAAMKQHKCRETDLPWLCSEVDKLRRPTVDCQYMPRSWDAQRAALAAQAKQGGA